MMKNEEEEEDRTIITFDERNSYTIILNRRLSLAIAIVTRAVLPTVVNIYYSFLRNQQLLVDNLCNQLLPSFLAFVANTISNSLSSVQRGITNPISRKINVGEESTTIDGESSSPTNAPEKSVDLIILSQPQGKIEADIIFIHGLHGGMGRTWTQRQWRQENQKPNEQSPTSGSNSNVKKSPSWKCTKCNNTCGISEEPLQGHCTNCIDNQDWKIVDYEKNVEFEYYSDCWPRDWITLDCPSVRVIALNYDTDVLWCPMWLRKRIRTGMVERSEEMIEELIKVGVGKQPIIWVGHSKGGLYIKQIILNAVERNFDNKEEIRNIKEQTKAIMFYSVPHKGSLLADVTLPFLRRSIELLEVQRNCDFVLDLDRRFINLCNQGDFSPEILSFIETAFTLMSFIFLKIVAYDSADIGIGTKYGVPLDHREICKPSSRDCFLYVELIKLIKRIISDQPE